MLFSINFYLHTRLLFTDTQGCSFLAQPNTPTTTLKTGTSTDFKTGHDCGCRAGKAHAPARHPQLCPDHAPPHCGVELLFVVEVRHAQRSLTKVLDEGGSYSLTN